MGARPCRPDAAGVAAVSGVSAALGYAPLDPESGRAGALAQAHAAGALLAMLADTLLPEAYEVEEVLAGQLVVSGFAISLVLDASKPARAVGSR